MGTSLREMIYDIGGGIKGGGEFKAVQIGGPSAADSRLCRMQRFGFLRQDLFYS